MDCTSPAWRDFDITALGDLLHVRVSEQDTKFLVVQAPSKLTIRPPEMGRRNIGSFSTMPLWGRNLGIIRRWGYALLCTMKANPFTKRKSLWMSGMTISSRLTKPANE